MSTVVIIRQKQDRVQTIDLNLLKDWVIKEKLYFGMMNQALAYQPYQSEEPDIYEKYFVIIDRKLFGRGFEFYVSEDDHIELTLHAFSTPTDIFIFYKFIRDVCAAYQIDEFEQDGERCFTDELNDLYKKAIAFHRYLVKEKLNPHVTIFGGIFPIAVEDKLINNIKLLKPSAAHKLYERYLDEKQKMDCYYGVPLLLEESSLHARYALIKDVPTILPQKAQLPAALQLKIKKPVQCWSVLLLKKEGDDLKEEAELDYEEFFKWIHSVKCPSFDQDHWIVTYDEKIDSIIQRWKKEQGKQKLIEWLCSSELGVSPKKIEYVKQFSVDDTLCRIYRYKKSWMGKWLLAIEWETGAFSAFQEYKPESAEEDAKAILKTCRQCSVEERG